MNRNESDTHLEAFRVTMAKCDAIEAEIAAGEQRIEAELNRQAEALAELRKITEVDND